MDWTPPETTIKLTKRTDDVVRAEDESAFELAFIKGRETFGGQQEPLLVWLASGTGRSSGDTSRCGMCGGSRFAQCSTPE